MASLVTVKTEHGHQQEFYNIKSTVIFWVQKGHGVFVIDDKRHAVGEGDVIVVPPRHRIYYAGALQLVEITTPAWKQDNEREVRRLSVQQLQAIVHSAEAGRNP